MLEKIKQLCDEQQISVSELERRANIAPKTIRRWDQNRPSVDKVYSVSKSLGVSIEELLNDMNDNGP